eukprot:TRINITY_DN10596_c1_g2_i1.p1 TRINITY_DN10596_c1_g2~~TRINITY_DN10596_c1_g2_i1.p1  ORF type:complete len:350 (+),score=63.82 TRINITY_DN10596_c1_g2_i1:114-1163(+)
MLKHIDSRESIQSGGDGGFEGGHDETRAYTPTSSIIPNLNEMTTMTNEDIIARLRNRVFELEAENDSLKQKLRGISKCERFISNSSRRHSAMQTLPTSFENSSLQEGFQHIDHGHHLPLEMQDSIACTSDAASDIIMAVDNHMNLVHIPSGLFRQGDGEGQVDDLQLQEMADTKLRERNSQLMEKLSMFEQNLIKLQDSVTEMDVQRVAAESCLCVALKQIDMQKGGWLTTLNPRQRRNQMFDMSKEWNELLEAKIRLLEDNLQGEKPAMLNEDKLLLENKLLRHEFAQLKVQIAELKGEMDKHKKNNSDMSKEKKSLFDRLANMQKLMDLRMGHQRPSPAEIIDDRQH